MLYLIKGLHVVLAALSIGAFLLRGYWMLQRSTLPGRRETRAAGIVVFVLAVAAFAYAVNTAITKNPLFVG